MGLRAIFFLLLITSPLAAQAQSATSESSTTQPTTAESPLVFPAWANDLDQARFALAHGRYEQAIALADAATHGSPSERTTIKSSALSTLGRTDEALAALVDTNDADERLCKARVLISAGQFKPAFEELQSLVTAGHAPLAAHFELGRAAELIGDSKEAITAYAWFINAPQTFLTRWTQDKNAFDNAEQLTFIGRALDRWANLTGAYAKQPALHDQIFAMFVRSFDVIDRGFGPAHVAAAAFELAHDDATLAKKELDAALEQNPHDPEALALVGQIGVSEWNFDRGDAMVKLLRGIDPQSFAADLLETRNLLQQRDPKDARLVAEKALAKQPNNLEALGLLAATEALQLRTDDLNATLARAEAIDPDNASAYFEVAQQLGAMRQYPRAAAMFKIALDREPNSTAVRNALGLLYTQSGDEDAAKVMLDAAHAVDPYNIETTNYLRLLDDLSKFTRKETDHFVVMYDAQADPIIPEYFSDYLESIHAQLVDDFQHAPPVKTYIEVFPTHDAFSVRTTGNAWIPTVGASTGRIIALVAPRRGEMTLGPFNWSQVLRHEYTHTITLAATDNRIAHWFTEGLAVWEEHSPLKWEWVPMLYDATTKHELFTLDNLTWGFVRPRKPTDRSMAYAESFWLVTYIEQTFGHPAILKMLDCFQAGDDEATTFQNALGRSRDQLQQEFFAWCDQQVAGWGYDPASTEKYQSLRDQGESLIAARQFADAVPIWQQIVKLRPQDALPHQRLAGLYLRPEVHQISDAIEQLKALDAVELKDNGFAKRIARLYRDEGDLTNAQRYALEATYINPYDPAAHDLLLEIADKSGDAAVADRERRVIPVLANWLAAQQPKAEAP